MPNTTYRAGSITLELPQDEYKHLVVFDGGHEPAKTFDEACAIADDLAVKGVDYVIHTLIEVKCTS